jgi:protein-disulfide isomerase
MQTKPDPLRPSPAKLTPVAIMGIVGALVVVVTLAALTLANRAAPVAATNTGGTIDAARLVRADSPVYGPADAKVTLVEFLDPECEACRAIHPIVNDLKTKYKDRFRLVVRYMPLHSNSVLAASAAEAAGEQGRYWQYLDVLYRTQTEWGEKQTPQRALFIDYARAINLDLAAFEKAMDNPKYAQKVERDRQDGVAVGVRGTPTFFLDGKLLELKSMGDLEAALKTALE